ncbi:MAG: hypothetical protein COU27_00675 [Candidatus Levybacteria bacterium CG10_big_fil_rev_8_21_14_0_10_36_7]|nr:MAG: hypothetical protein COU27_00675 [Candidatus Levybacteria bacterium CG10_big_fil_rev_8_21_14_0_10_36_7]
MTNIENGEQRLKIATLHNRVIIAKKASLGSDNHAIAIITLAREIADNPNSISVLKDLNNGKK